MKINLLYDMTRIIQAWNNDNLKRGVYTVCYNLFKELIKRNEIDLYFYCHRNYNDALKTFLQSNFPEVAEKIIINDNSSPFLKKINAFFSPQHKIPDFIEERPDICKFLFIHDVMPLVIPGLEKDLEKGSWIGEVIRSINSTDYYFTNSECSKRDIINYVKEASSDHIKVIPLGVADNFHPCKDEAKILSIKKKYNIPKNKKYLFSLCALDDRKNLLMQVSAFFELIKVNKIHDLVYVLGGSGADDFLEKLKSTLTAKDFQKFKDKILKIGYVADKDLASLYSGAEWFTFTSKYEGFGLPVLEAMACGCPVITSNNSSLPEVIGDAGIMIDCSSKQKHIDAYKKYYFSETLRKKNSQKGLERARLFTWEKAVSSILDVVMLRLMENIKFVPVVMFTDNNYVIPTIVTITSLIENKNVNTEYGIYVLGNNLSEENLRLLNSLSGVKAENHKSRFSQFEGTHQHVSSTDLFKFDLPETFPQYDKILYMDVDMIVQGDLSSLYATELGDNYVAAVKDIACTLRGKHHIRNNLSFYFNAGMMLLNLKKMRNENISEKLIDYKLHKDQGFFMSQDALNCTFAERVILLSPTYNYIKKSWDLFDINKICEFYNITQEECDKIQKKSLILHLADKSKPWKTAHTWGSNLWKNYYLLSPLKNKKFFYVDDKKYMLREDYSKKIKIISIDCNQSTKTVKLFNMFPVFHETTRIWNNGDFKIKKYFLGIRFYSKLTAIRPNIVLVYDFPDWIIGRWAQQIKRVLKDKYNFILTTFYQVKDSPEYYKELFKKVDVVHLLVAYPYEYYKTLTDRTKILPTIHHWLDYDKQIKGIATDCCQIVTGSSQWKKSMIKNGISPYKVDVIFSGIEDRFLQEHKPLYRKNKKIINIGFFAKASSNNEDRKGTRHFMALLNEIKQQNKQKLFHIYLTGAGWEQFVKQIKKEEFKVTYIPFVSDEDMPRLYKTLDFYLMLSDVEGGPVTVIEAMASKTPVLATNIGVVQDIGEDKKNIILIDNKNSKDILQKILYYKEHQTELDDIINNAYKTAQNMTYDKTFAPLEQVYNKFLCGRKLTGALLDFDTLNKHFMRKAYSVQDEKKQRNYVPWKLFGLSRNTEICKFYFFGIPIFSSRQGTKKNGDIKLKHYFCGLPYFVKEKANFKKIYKFLGLSRTKYKNILRKTFSFSKQSLTSSDIKGLSKPEKWGRWSDGKTVDMKIKLPTDKGDLRCCFGLKPFLNEKIKQQIVSVSINDRFIVDWIFELGKPAPKTEFIIPKSLLKKSGKTYFSFKIKNPVSPWILGINEDRRNLGICFISMQIVPAVVKETKFQKYWKQLKMKIMPEPQKDYSAEFKTLSDELVAVRRTFEDLQKEIKTLKTEQVMTQKMLVDEKTLLQKKRRFK